MYTKDMIQMLTFLKWKFLLVEHFGGSKSKMILDGMLNFQCRDLEKISFCPRKMADLQNSDF